MSPEELRHYLHHNVPLTQHMQISVDACTTEQLTLYAPLEPNANHHGTAFGGSIASLAVLCGWCMTHIRTESEALSSDLFVQKATIEYHKAIEQNIRASCTGPSEEAWQSFAESLQSRGKGRLHLEVQVFNGDVVAATLEANYAARLKT